MTTIQTLSRDTLDRVLSSLFELQCSVRTPMPLREETLLFASFNISFRKFLSSNSEMPSVVNSRILNYIIYSNSEDLKRASPLIIHDEL